MTSTIGNRCFLSTFWEGWNEITVFQLALKPQTSGTYFRFPCSSLAFQISVLSAKNHWFTIIAVLYLSPHICLQPVGCHHALKEGCKCVIFLSHRFFLLFVFHWRSKTMCSDVILALQTMPFLMPSSGWWFDFNFSRSFWSSWLHSDDISKDSDSLGGTLTWLTFTPPSKNVCLW